MLAKTRYYKYLILRYNYYLLDRRALSTIEETAEEVDIVITQRKAMVNYATMCLDLYYKMIDRKTGQLIHRTVRFGHFMVTKEGKRHICISEKALFIV